MAGRKGECGDGAGAGIDDEADSGVDVVAY
jgi:hypothetical protein